MREVYKNNKNQQVNVSLYKENKIVGMYYLRWWGKDRILLIVVEQYDSS
jgi:hypothetical protein